MNMRGTPKQTGKPTPVTREQPVSYLPECLTGNDVRPKKKLERRTV